MLQIGYKLSSEEHGPNELVRFARLAEEHGFTFALISDHFHPWIDRQGQSPFVWSVIGALAHATKRLSVGTGVTCPTMRIHPAIVAQAAATAAVMMPGRFFLGVGSGENLNEHIVAARWPANLVRLEMMEEAITLIRLLWEGGLRNHHGRHYTVENARLYTRPAEPPPIMIAAGGQRAATLAGRLGDGLVMTSPKREIVATFDEAGGRGKPHYAEITVCWASDEAAARRTVREVWPIVAIPSDLHQELPLPSHFAAAGKLVTDEMVAKEAPCGPDPAPYVEEIQKYADAGFDHVCVHQVGADQEGFIRFFAREVMPRLGTRRAAA